MNGKKWFTTLAIALVALLQGLSSASAASQLSDQEKIEALKGMGVGSYVYSCELMHGPDRVAALALKCGLGHINIKANDGKKWFIPPAELSAQMAVMHARGLQNYPWGLTYANDPDREFRDVIQKVLDDPSSDGYILDTEGEIESPAKWKNVQRLLDLIDEHQRTCPICRNKLIGFTPYMWPSKHPNLPYVQLVGKTDFINPQMYFADAGYGVDEGIAKTYAEWSTWEKKNNLERPIIPLGQTYPSLNGVPYAAGDVRRFGELTKGYYSVEYYDLGHATRAQLTEMREVVQMRSNGQAIQPVEKPVSDQPFWARWWLSWQGMYWRVAAVLLIAGCLLALYPEERQARYVIAAAALVVGLLWDWLLVAILISVILAMIAALIYGIIMLCQYLRERKAGGD